MVSSLKHGCGAPGPGRALPWSPQQTHFCLFVSIFAIQQALALCFEPGSIPHWFFTLQNHARKSKCPSCRYLVGETLLEGHLLSHLLNSMGRVTTKSRKVVKFPSDAFTDFNFSLSKLLFSTVQKSCCLASAYFLRKLRFQQPLVCLQGKSWF